MYILLLTLIITFTTHSLLILVGVLNKFIEWFFGDQYIALIHLCRCFHALQYQFVSQHLVSFLEVLYIGTVKLNILQKVHLLLVVTCGADLVFLVGGSHVEGCGVHLGSCGHLALAHHSLLGRGGLVEEFVVAWIVVVLRIAHVKKVLRLLTTLTVFPGIYSRWSYSTIGQVSLSTCCRRTYLRVLLDIKIYTHKIMQSINYCYEWHWVIQLYE